MLILANGGFLLAGRAIGVLLTLELIKSNSGLCERPLVALSSFATITRLVLEGDKTLLRCYCKLFQEYRKHFF